MNLEDNVPRLNDRSTDASQHFVLTLIGLEDFTHDLSFAPFFENFGLFNFAREVGERERESKIRSDDERLNVTCV